MRKSVSQDLVKTDWTAYYKQKKSWVSAYTQQFTLEKILYALGRYAGTGGQKGLRIAELGGGNSCFAKKLCEIKKVDAYDIVDSNALAVRLFNEMEIKAGTHKGIRHDLLNQEKDEGRLGNYDFVYSIGLIEHFRGEDIWTVINRHYDYCRPGGIVMVSFPTPTRKYIAVRKCMEALGAWQFHDEKPIRYGEVAGCFAAHGTVFENFVNRKLPLTQMVVIAANDAKGGNCNGN